MLLLTIVAVPGCGNVLTDAPAPLFGAPLIVAGSEVGPAIIDTGGAFEVMLSEPFGLELIDSVEVLVFGGAEIVEVTEGFEYSAGGWSGRAESAIVGVSICDCNGIGFHFFRDSGAVLEIDFQTLDSAFVDEAPIGGIQIPYVAPPQQLPFFTSSFVAVTVASRGRSIVVIGLLDTGTNASVMKRGLFAEMDGRTSSRRELTVSHDQLGSVPLSVTLFENDGLPDLILGTDAMRAWASLWYFVFSPTGGAVTVFPTGRNSVLIEEPVEGPLAKRFPHPAPGGEPAIHQGPIGRR